MNRTHPGLVLAAALSVAMSSALAAPPSPPGITGSVPSTCGAPGNRIVDRLSLRMHGLTADQRLVCFREHAPQVVTTVGFVNGLVTDTGLVGIDYRVQDGLLYGVGDAGGVYVINPDNAVASLLHRLSIALDGDFFGVDFNPAADRLRVISNDGQNLRHDLSTGTTVQDGVLNYTAGTTALSLNAAAYTNNDLDASTAATLFDIDTILDQVVIQAPANSGNLSATGKLTVDVQGSIGMDIYSTVRNGVTVSNEAFAALTPSDGTEQKLYKLELTTGKAMLRGSFGDIVLDIAIPLGQR